MSLIASIAPANRLVTPAQVAEVWVKQAALAKPSKPTRAAAKK